MNYITSGSKEQSFLYLKVNGSHATAGGNNPGDQMPKNNPAWPPSTIELLGQWIDAELPTPENCD